MTEVTVYGAGSCQDTQATRNHLDSLGVQYKYVDLDHDRSAADWTRQQNGGNQATPTVEVQGRLLFNPDERELEMALRGTGLMS